MTSQYFQMSQIETLPVTSKELRQETGKNIELGLLLEALKEEVYQLMLRFQMVTLAEDGDTSPRRGVHQFQISHFLGVPGESCDIPRDLIFKEMWLFLCNQLKTDNCN
ncbi:hypothetical protein TNCT_203631 [Trichonephila clavata]|uniref:Uncharacterized protein n=1 Tax=Trichonephila clavata TaxID=2740835 RepID=A0A8X6FYW9_TRICU|nr:hypothetical protein TNCT_203631 [Trichonephila clavata]